MRGFNLDNVEDLDDDDDDVCTSVGALIEHDPLDGGEGELRGGKEVDVDDAVCIGHPGYRL